MDVHVSNRVLIVGTAVGHHRLPLLLNGTAETYACNSVRCSLAHHAMNGSPHTDLVVRSHELCGDGYRIQEGGKV